VVDGSTTQLNNGSAT